MKKRYILLLMATALITLGGCAKGSDAEQTSGDDSVSSEQSASEEDKGGMSSSDSDDMEASAQKAYDLYANYYGLLNGYINYPIEIGNRYYEEHENEDYITKAKNCKYNYDALTSEEKEAFDKDYPNVKNHYTFYEGGEFFDIYTGLTYECDGLIGELDNLSDEDYNWIYLTTYRIQDGKIYGEVNSEDLEGGGVYKFEGELAVNEFPYDCTPEWLESHKDNLKNTLDSFIQDGKIQNDVDFEETVENYEAYLEEWKTASYVGEDAYDGVLTFFKIKDYKDGTLIAEDCYREVPSYSDYLKSHYSEN